MKYLIVSMFVLKNVMSASWLDHEALHYAEEKAKGSMAYLIGSNQHYSHPRYYKDLSRRFVPQYPYIEIPESLKEDNHLVVENSVIPLKASPELVLAIAEASRKLEEAKPVDPTSEVISKGSLRSGNYWDAVWKEDDQKKLLRSGHVEKLTEEESNPSRGPPEMVYAVAETNPSDPTSETLSKGGVLRCGNVWFEDVGQQKPLRSRDVDITEKKLGQSRDKVLNIVPGSELYQLINKLAKISPKLIYVINKQ